MIGNRLRALSFSRFSCININITRGAVKLRDRNYFPVRLFGYLVNCVDEICAVGVVQVVVRVVLRRN